MSVSLLASSQLSSLSDSAIHDTVEVVFRQRAYARGFLRMPEWLLQFSRWLQELIRGIDLGMERSPVLYWGSIVLLAAILVLVVVRAAWARSRRVALSGVAEERRARGSGLPRDPWLAAQARAARGDFTEAAHALYRALLATLARRGQVKLHPSKTVGDYVRELRSRSSALFSRFRDFARSYEVVVYGVGECDRTRWERLRSLADPIVMRDA